jgi:hypothetical protein
MLLAVPLCGSCCVSQPHQLTYSLLDCSCRAAVQGPKRQRCHRMRGGSDSAPPQTVLLVSQLIAHVRQLALLSSVCSRAFVDRSPRWALLGLGNMIRTCGPILYTLGGAAHDRSSWQASDHHMHAQPVHNPVHPQLRHCECISICELSYTSLGDL